MTDLQTHFAAASIALADGSLVPFLGAGFNLCDRPIGITWDANQRTYLPTGAELSDYLADTFSCHSSDRFNLTQVSQHVETLLGSGPLYNRIRQVLARDYPVTSAHLTIVRLLVDARNKRTAPSAIGPQLIVTTNYDDLLEAAFREAREPFHLVTYVADGPDRGRFHHVHPDGRSNIIYRPNEYDDFPGGTVILKIHGTLNRLHADQDSFVITEDHYIEYLSRIDLPNLVPAPLLARLRHCNFLFLGYGLRDWNLRVVLHRIAVDRLRSYQSWAVQHAPEPIDYRFWLMRRVELIDMDAHAYLLGLEAALKGTRS